MQRGAMGDAPSGAFLAGGVGTALFKRERTGKGVLVDVALLGAAPRATPIAELLTLRDDGKMLK